MARRRNEGGPLKSYASAGLRVVFDPALERSAWPGPVGHGEAAIDEAWLGVRGFLGRLETELGLGGLYPSASERAVSLTQALANTNGYWSASYEADPVGTAERLLADRDLLAMWGWRGEPAGPRLSALAAVTAGALPGMADRLRAVLRALEERRTAIHLVTLASPVRLLPTLWRLVLDALRTSGTTVDDLELEAAPAAGDLMAARGTSFAPEGDGSLTLYRPHGSLAGAEALAGALVARGSLDGVLIVGADKVLADALARAGLPRPSVDGNAPASFGVLRLLVELMFEPADPALLYKLLCLDPGPVPRSIARRLIDALSRVPGRGTAKWNEALEEGLAKVDESRRERLRARITGLVEPVARRGETVSVAQVVERMKIVSTWARGFADSVPSVLGVGGAAEACTRLLQALPDAELTWVELRRLLDDVEGGGAYGPAAEAGLACVDHPGAVLGPCDVIIWWGFTRDRAPRARRLRLSESERKALADLGISPPSSSATAESAALAWRRPLEQARQHLVLVCPRTVEASEKGFPHPLWDELVASMGGGGPAAILTTDQLVVPVAPKRSPVSLRPLPEAQEIWTVDRPVPERENGDSPSSLESLLGCSLQWALRYHGKLCVRFSAPPAPGPLLNGSLAHLLIAEVFGEGALNPDQAEARALALLDSELPRMCETLFLPRYQVELAGFRRAVVDSARELAQVIDAMGATVRGVEQKLEGEVSGVQLGGIADMLLDNPESVIDLKWGKTTNKAKLKSGTALQLAAYAELARQGEARPQIAYFILRNQELLAEPGTSFPGATVPGHDYAIDIWRGAMASLELVRKDLAEGSLSSPGAVTDEIEGGLADGELTMSPGCRYCDYAALCGRGAPS